MDYSDSNFTSNQDGTQNIFVTQITDRDNETDLDALIIKETPQTLLKTGLNTFQDTLVVCKEKELIDVNEILSQKRFDFEKIMSKHKQKRNELMTKQQAFLNQIQTFNSFIEDNNAKRRRALVKYQSEIRLMELQKQIEQEIQKDIENTKHIHGKLLKKVKRNKIYEDFLLQTVECLPPDYIKFTDNVLGGLIMRYNTLQTTNEALFAAMMGKAEQSNQHFKLISSLHQDHENSILRNNYRLSLLYEEYDRLQDQLERSEQAFRIKHGNLREEILEFGLTLRAIDNISQKCSRKFDEDIVNTDFGSKIQKIQEYVMTTKQIIEVVKQMKDNKQMIQLPQIPSKITLSTSVDVPRQSNSKISNISGRVK